MAFPTFVGHGGAVQESTGTLTVVNNAGAITGDYEILVCETADEAVTLTTSGGFVELTNVQCASGTATIRTRGTFFERIYSGQADPVTNDPGNHIIANIFTFRRSSGSWGSLSDARSSVGGTGWQTTAETVEDTSGSMNGITTDTADQLICGFICCAKPDIAGGTAEMSGITNSNLANITERHDDAAASGNGGWIGAWTGEEATSAQAIGATTFTLANLTFKAMLVVALRDSPPSSTVTFAASIAGTGAVTVASVNQISVAATIAGLGAVAVDVVRDKRTFDASIAGLGTLTVEAAVQRAFEAAIAGLGTLTVDVSKVRLLEVNVAGTGAMAVDFVNQLGLDVVVAGAGSLAVDAAVQKSLEAAISGSGVVSVDLARQVGLEVVMAGVSQVLVDVVRNPLFMAAAVAGNGVVTVDVTVSTPAGDVLTIRTLVGVGL